MGSAFMHGWIGLPTEGEMQLEHGVPRRVRVAGTALVDVERLADEIADVTGLHVTLAHWEPADVAGELEAVLHVNSEDLAAVLQLLAHASAEAFYDRYHKPMDVGDVDFDDEAYAQDFNLALGVCGLHWGQIDQAALRDRYRLALHGAVDAIVRHPD